MRVLSRGLGLLLLALLGQACASGSRSPFPDRVRLPGYSEPAGQDESHGEYVLPTRQCGDFFLVDAWVNGEGPFPLLLDSGAGRTVLDPAVLTEAGIGNAMDSLRIGEFVAYGAGAGELEMTELSFALREPVMGILGHPIFAGGTITYDYPRGEIRLSREPLSPEDPGVVRARESSRPWVVGEAGGKRFWVLLDTGSSRGLSLVDLESWAGAESTVMTGASMRVDGLHPTYSARAREDFRVGPLVLKRPIAGNSVSVNLMGQQVLHRFAVTFDARNDLVRFRRPDGPVEAPLTSSPLTGSGFTVRPLGDKRVVQHVLPSSPADLAGLEAGDTILAVDGVPVDRLGCRARWAERAPEADTVSLTLRNGAVVQELRVGRTVLVR